jgi:hypothetical protein
VRLVLPLHLHFVLDDETDARGQAMRHKTSHLRGIRAALTAAGSTIHPALTPGSALWFWALAAAVVFAAFGWRTPEVRS